MTSFSSFLCHPLTVPLVDVGGYGDDCIKGVVDLIGLGELVLDERRQMLPVLDQLVIVTEPCATYVLFEQRDVVLDRLGPLPQLFERHERVAGLVNHFKPHAEGGDKCWIIGEWESEGLHSLDDICRPIGGISFQERAYRDDPQLVIRYPSRHCCRSSVNLHTGPLV